MNQDLAQDIRCPVCREIPKKNVFQCKDGHVICEDCFVSDLEVCSQCGVPYGTDRIRCRVLESLLDSMKFECDYKEQGCLEKVSRDKLESHLEECQFCPGVPLCRLIGFKDCNYKFDELKFHDGLDHLIQTHKIKQSPPTTDMQVPDLENARGSTTTQINMWGRPLLLPWEDDTTDKDHPTWFLVSSVIHNEDESLFCAFIQLNRVEKAEAKFEAQFEIGSRTNKIPSLCWKQFPIKLECFEDYLNMAPFRTNLKDLKERYIDEEEGLIVKMSLLKIPDESARPSVHYSKMNKPPIPPRGALNLHLKKKMSPTSSLSRVDSPADQELVPPGTPLTISTPLYLSPSSTSTISVKNLRSKVSNAISGALQSGPTRIESNGDSSSMEAVLMALFWFETSFNKCLTPSSHSSASVVNEMRKVLLEEVVTPLQKFECLPLVSGAVAKLGGLLGSLKPEFRNAEIDAGDFVSTLFGTVLSSNPFFKTESGGNGAGFVFETFAERTSHTQPCTSVQKLLNANFGNSKVSFDDVPKPGFIVKLPFTNGKPVFEKVLPNLEISLGKFVHDKRTNPKMLLSAVICREANHHSVFVRTGIGKCSMWTYLNSLNYHQVYRLPELGQFLETWENVLWRPSVKCETDKLKYNFLMRTAYICIYVPQSQ